MPCSSPVHSARRTVRSSLQVERLQDPHRLEHHRAAGGVVGGAGAGVPRVEVRADHHHLVRFAAAGDLGDHVRGLAVGVFHLDAHLELHAHRLAALDEPGDAAVALGREHHHRRRHRRARDARSRPPRRTRSRRCRGPTRRSRARPGRLPRAGKTRAAPRRATVAASSLRSPRAASVESSSPALLRVLRQLGDRPLERRRRARVGRRLAASRARRRRSASRPGRSRAPVDLRLDQHDAAAQLAALARHVLADPRRDLGGIRAQLLLPAPRRPVRAPRPP